jgi:PAS domain S-box-containing protein
MLVERILQKVPRILRDRQSSVGSLPVGPEPEARASEAAAAAGMGVFELWPETRTLHCCTRCKELFGFAADERVTRDNLVAALHPDDRAAWESALAEAARYAGDREYHIEFRTVAQTPRWIAADGRALFEGGRGPRVVGLLQDITARKQAERARGIAIGMVAHDLRDPLSAILMQSRLMKQKGDPAWSEPSDRLVSCATRMNRMIEQLTYFARGCAGELQLDVRAVDMVRVCRDVVSELTIAHPGRTIELSSSGDTKGQWDEDRLAQVVQNLLSNALKHGDARATVAISVAGSGNWVMLEVVNEGRPIPEELRAHLFDPFRRGIQRSDGLGLGLYIAREIVLAHDGSIEAQSNHARTMFRVRLPKTTAHR